MTTKSSWHAGRACVSRGRRTGLRRRTRLTMGKSAAPSRRRRRRGWNRPGASCAWRTQRETCGERTSKGLNHHTTLHERPCFGWSGISGDGDHNRKRGAARVANAPEIRELPLRLLLLVLRAAAPGDVLAPEDHLARVQDADQGRDRVGALLSLLLLLLGERRGVRRRRGVGGSGRLFEHLLDVLVHVLQGEDACETAIGEQGKHGRSLARSSAWPSLHRFGVPRAAAVGHQRTQCDAGSNMPIALFARRLRAVAVGRCESSAHRQVPSSRRRRQRWTLLRAARMRACRRPCTPHITAQCTQTQPPRKVQDDAYYAASDLVIPQVYVTSPHPEGKAFSRRAQRLGHRVLIVVRERIEDDLSSLRSPVQGELFHSVAHTFCCDRACLRCGSRALLESVPDWCSCPCERSAAAAALC